MNAQWTIARVITVAMSAVSCASPSIATLNIGLIGSISSAAVFGFAFFLWARLCTSSESGRAAFRLTSPFWPVNQYPLGFGALMAVNMFAAALACALMALIHETAIPSIAGTLALIGGALIVSVATISLTKKKTNDEL